MQLEETISIHQEQESSIEDIKNLVIEEFKAVDQLILNHLQSDVPLIQQISEHIITSGGKRLRPLIVLLAAKCFNYTGDCHIALAAIIEFIHTATLLHDDVVDNSSLRRGQKTANVIWGNAASVLVGDFLYSRTFQILTQINHLPVMELLAKTTNAIAEGEVLQLINRNDPYTSEAQYMKVIQNKTAKLFEAAAEVGALLCHRTQSEQQAMAKFGLHLGTAFQLIDDALDYNGDIQKLGKNVGDDLAEGKPTLPLIYAMQHCQLTQKKMIQNAITQGGLENLSEIQNAIDETRALEYTLKKAEEEIKLSQYALKQIQSSVYQNGLYALTDFAIQRTY